MKQIGIGRVYRIPSSNIASPYDLAETVGRILRRHGYNVRLNIHSNGEVYNSNRSKLLGIIRDGEVSTMNRNRSFLERLGLKTPQLDKLLEDLTLEQLEEQR